MRSRTSRCSRWNWWAPNCGPSRGVTGRLTRGKVAAAGALSGLWIGLFVGIAFSLFSADNQAGFLITTPALGAVFGLVWSQIGYSTATRRGSRDFTSANQIVATKYEVLVEHTGAARARGSCWPRCRSRRPCDITTWAHLPPGTPRATEPALPCIIVWRKV